MEPILLPELLLAPGLRHPLPPLLLLNDGLHRIATAAPALLAAAGCVTASARVGIVVVGECPKHGWNGRPLRGLNKPFLHQPRIARCQPKRQLLLRVVTLEVCGGGGKYRRPLLVGARLLMRALHLLVHLFVAPRALIFFRALPLHPLLLFDLLKGVPVDERDEPSLRGVLHLAEPLLSQHLNEFGERFPFRRVHVDVMLVGNELVVHHRGGNSRMRVTDFHVLHESLEEDVRISLNHSCRRCSEHHHLLLVRFGHGVALEAVLVAALFVAHLAVPTQLLQPLGLYSVPDCLG
mmetsp:Transcript_25701/g.43061  ORF Transcript_25701/g.43061 Transcript_25701/m.43061 type:complete len:293 (-) Transcript_25701:208-1086(-)